MKKSGYGLYLRRSVIFTILFVVLAVVLSQFTYITTDFFDEYFNWGPMVTISIVALLITVGYMPLRRVLVRISDKALYMGGYDYYHTLEEISDWIGSYNTLDELGAYIVRVIRDTMKLTHVSLYVRNRYTGEYPLFSTTTKSAVPVGSATGSTPGFLEGEPFHIKEIDERAPGVKSGGLPDTMTEMAVKIEKNGHILGFLALGPKLSGQTYSSEDKRILLTLASHLATAIENTTFFKELSDKAEKLGALNGMQRSVSYACNDSDIYSSVLQEISHSFESSEACLFLIGNEAVRILCSGSSSDDHEQLSVPPSLLKKMFPDLAPVLRNPEETAENIIDEWFCRRGIHEYLAVPLLDRQKIIGVMTLGNCYEPGYVRAVDLGVLKIYCNYIENLVINFSLYRETKRARKYLESIIESVPSIIIVVGATGRIKRLNAAGESRFAVSPGAGIEELLMASTELHALYQSISEGKRESILKEITLRAGDTFLCFCCRIVNDSRNEDCLLVMTDISEIKHLKQELLQRERIVAIARMASVIVHEIRNPLTSVKALVKLMPKQHNDDEYLELFSQIVPRELERVNMLMEDLLEFSRSKKIKQEPVDLLELLQERKNALQISAREAKVSVQLDGEPMVIPGDRNRLTQVIQNLMQNAVQAMENGGVLTMALDRVPNQTEDDGIEYARICIQDNGCGMDEKTRKSLFELFFTTKRNGTGLGLVICKKIIEEHGGYIEVESSPGKGSRFNIFLPASVADSVVG